MVTVNRNYLKLPGSYLVPNCRKSVRFSKGNPEARILRLGIGDVTQPLAPAIIEVFTDQWMNGTSGNFPGVCTGSGL